MNLAAYLDRIRFNGKPKPDVNSLEALMQAHVCTVPFENLDVQFRKPLTTSVEEAYDKIVERWRGGWCYEMNGLFGWVLAEVGFSVTRIGAAVRDDLENESKTNNHLLLTVTAPGDDTTWLVDVGFGGSHFGPIPLEPLSVVHEPYELSIEQLPQGRWRFTESNLDSRSLYDFVNAPADEAALSERCHELQTSFESSFVLSLVAQRRTPTTHQVLRGRVYQEVSREERLKQRIESADELVTVFRDRFGIDAPELESLWPRVLARHEELGLG